MCALNSDTSNGVMVTVKIILLSGTYIANELTAHGPLRGPVFVERLGGLFVHYAERSVETVVGKHVEAATVKDWFTSLRVIDRKGNGDGELKGGFAVSAVVGLEWVSVGWVFAEVVYEGAEGSNVGFGIGARRFVETPELGEGNVGVCEGFDR